MADISWTAYALAMFTPEERAAAVDTRPLPPEPLSLPLPPINYGIPVIPSGDPGSGSRVTVGTVSYDTNNPLHLRILYDLGWYFFQGSWVPPIGTMPRTVDEARAGGFVRPSSLSAVPTASFFQGMTVLGQVVPVAAPVLLPLWVGGIVGFIRMGEGMRPESGGEERFIWGERVMPQIVWDS